MDSMGLERIGYAKGIVWTPFDSHLIQLSVKVKKGTGNLKIIGDVGENFLESLEPIFICLERLLHDTIDINTFNLTLDVPGAIEGMSASCAIFIALYSAITKIPINQDLAFIGAILANGSVDGVGEVKSKVEAAKRAGLEGLVLPTLNMDDIELDVYRGLYIYPVSNVSQVVKIATA